MTSIYDEIQCKQCCEKKIRFFFGRNNPTCKQCLSKNKKAYDLKHHGKPLCVANRKKVYCPAYEWASITRNSKIHPFKDAEAS